MKNSVVLYNVSAMLNRLSSNITPIKYILTLVALLCISSNMWGWRGAKIHIYSQPEDCGYVYANTSNSGSASNLTYDYAEKSEEKTGKTTYSFYLFNLPKPGYKFMGYSDNKSATTGVTNNQFGIECGTAWWGVYTEKTYYAIFAPITYTIAFNGNGSTSGTMSNLSMVYNTAKNLTANAYARQYIVTYDADGGTSSVNSASATYSFVGWAKSPTGSVEYSDKQSVSNLTTTANAIVTLYAQWKSASVILPNATKVGAVIDGWYAGGVRVGEPGDSYTPTANVTLTAKWIDKYTPEITGNDYTLFVEGEQANAFSFKYTDNPIAHIEVVSISAVNDGRGKVISYDAKNNKIIAHNAGEATIFFTQQETETIKDGTSAKFTVKVSKHQTAFSGEEYSMMVDGKQTANYTYTNTSAAQPTASNSDSFYYTIDDNDFANEELNKGTDLITFNPSTKQITACNAGTAKITLHQKETYKYTGATASYNVTVNKYTPDFTWNTGNATYYYLSSVSNIFATTNPDCQYTIVSDNEHVAKVIGNTLHIYNVEETANITVTQAENYKWNGKTETYTIIPVPQNNHVQFTVNAENYYNVFRYSNTGNLSWTNDGILLGSPDVWSESGNYDDRYYDISFTGVPDKLSFTYARSTSIATGCDWFVKESVDGVNWNASNVWEAGNSNEGSVEVQLNPTTRYLRFCYSGNYGGYFRNITVTELEKFEAGPKPLDFGTQSVNFGQQEKQVVFEHANIGRETTVTIEGADKDFFSVSPTTISNTGRDLYGTAYLNVTFDNGTDIRGDKPYTATLVIIDNAGHREEVALTGVRNGKATPVFTWNPNNFPYYFNTSIANIVVSSNTDYANCPLTITSSNPSIAKVENGRLYIYNQSGEVTFTVTQRGNEDYYEHTETYTFTPKAKPDLEVPFQMTQLVYDEAVTPGYRCYWDGSENEIRLGENCGILEEGAWDWNKKSVIIVFAGTPGKLSFQYKASNSSATDVNWMVEESVDGDQWNTIWESSSTSTEWQNLNDIEIKPTTQYLRFSYDGNFAGYFKNINVSELVGYKYLRAADGQYLSRGAKWGTQAVVDAFGVVARISRYTQDNENIYTRFFFVDNEQYMFETETDDDQRLHEVFTDNGTALNTNHLWQINDNGGVLTIQSANEVGEVSHKGNYITAVNGVLAFTTNEAEATQWQMEDYTEHPQYITDMLNRQAANAAVKDFGKDINTLEKVRNRLKEEDFETHPITIPALALGEQTGEGRTLEGMPHIYEQTITGLDTGFYRLTVQALYRISNSEIAWKCNQEKGKESVLAYAYANNVQYPIQSVYASYHSSAFENTDELHNGKYYSTTLTSAEVAFNDANRYLNDVYVYVAPDPDKTTGTLRYGIKIPSYVPGAWLAYENVTLTHFKRKEFIFEGKDDNNTTTPTQWTEQYNWNRDLQPNQYHVAIIQADVIIDTEVSVHSMIIDPSINPDVKVTIAPNGGLTVGAGGVKGATTDNFIIKASTEGATKGQTGYIRISPYTEQPMPKATMEMYSKAYYDMAADDRNNVGSWQYVGSPMAEAETAAKSIYKSSWIYNWNEATAEWENNRKTLILKPFEGYCTSQYKYPEGMLITNTGQLASNGNVILNLSYTGDADTLRCNVFANSYAAPIDITRFVASDFSEGVEATINLFNTGSKNNIADQVGKTDLDASGQYIAIPVATAAELVANHNYPAIIPAMQGFFVNTTKAGTLKLNYERLVWNADYTKHTNAPLRTKERSTTTGALCVSIEADGWRDNLYLLESEDYEPDFQNGYDARKMMNGELNIFAVEEEQTYLAVDATHSLIGTRVGVRTGEETAYTFTFANLRTQDAIALLDNETEQIIPIVEGATYTFFATPNTMITNRFVIVANEDVDGEGVATDIQNPIVGTKLHKFIKDNKLFILKDGILYNAQGQLVSK